MAFLTSVSYYATRGHVLDWLAVVTLWVLRYFLHNIMHPNYRMFYLDDVRISFPIADPETVSGLALMIYSLLIPLGTLILWAIISRPGVRKAHLAILGLLCSTSVTTFIVGVLKNAVGRPRPDLISRCQPRSDVDLHALSTYKICQQTDLDMLNQGFRSFPSGHSGSAFGGLAYLSFFLAAQFRLLRHPHSAPFPTSSWSPPNLFLVLIALAPLIGAALIAISRLQDYRHDFADVIVGSLIGASTAYVCWRRFFPRLGSADCSDPYPDKIGSERLPRDSSASGSARGGAYASLHSPGIPVAARDDDIELGER